MKRYNVNFKNILQLRQDSFALFTLFTFMEFVWIPLNSWISEGLLAMTGHAYLSPTNLLSVFAENLLVTGLFILLFLSTLPLPI